MACAVSVSDGSTEIANTDVCNTVTVVIGVQVCCIVAWFFDFSSVSEAESRAEENYRYDLSHGANQIMCCSYCNV